jgi:hypothetical protein
VAKRAERVQARCRDRDPVLLLPTLAEAACRCTSTTSVTGRTTTVCPHTTTCTSTTSVTGRITTVCR